MGEEDEVMAALGEAGVLAGVRWAYRSAVNRSLELYSEEDGLDVPWLGTTRYTYFRDRLDRVFSCERYAVSSTGDDPYALVATLSKDDVDTMPRLAPGLVVRSDLNRSPGWLHDGRRRFLLAACEYGQLGSIPWQQKSPTKQQVARQPSPDPPAVATLFDALGPDEVGDVLAAFERRDDHGVDTFVVAHTLDPVTGSTELVIGRPQLDDGREPWRWRRDVLDLPPFTGGRRIDDLPRPAGPSTEPDAPVRLRPSAGEQPAGEAGDGGRPA